VVLVQSGCPVAVSTLLLRAVFHPWCGSSGGLLWRWRASNWSAVRRPATTAPAPWAFWRAGLAAWRVAAGRRALLRRPWPPNAARTSTGPAALSSFATGQRSLTEWVAPAAQRTGPKLHQGRSRFRSALSCYPCGLIAPKLARLRCAVACRWPAAGGPARAWPADQTAPEADLWLGD